MNVGRSTVSAAAFLGHERVDMNAVFGILDCLSVVHTAAVAADLFVFFDVDQDIVWEAYVHEGVHSASEGLQALGLARVVGEVSEDKAILGLAAQSEELDVHTLFEQALVVLCVDHVPDSQEERVGELLVLTCLIYHIL